MDAITKDNPAAHCGEFFCTVGNICVCECAMCLNAPFPPVDWSSPIETNETPPRPARVIGKSKGAIDYVVVEIGDYENMWGWAYPSNPDHPDGEYAAAAGCGVIRGNLAIRNIR